MLFEENRPLLMGLLVREAGRTVPNALSEVREAVDFLRYYAKEARANFSGARTLPGPAGRAERAQALRPRRVHVHRAVEFSAVHLHRAKSPAALAAGNSVLAKPAEQTPLIAAAAVRLLLEAGVPGDVAASRCRATARASARRCWPMHG